MELNGKVVVVTGAAGVLGAAVVRRAVELGATPVSIDVVAPAGDAPGAAHVVDLLDRAAVAECFRGLGRVDAVCNVAGGFDMGPTVYETDDALWNRMFEINVTTLRHVLAAAVPGMVERRRGSIVNVGALGALSGLPNMGAYTAAKSVVMRLTEALSAEVRSKGVNVNAVLPSLIDTPRNRADMPGDDFSKWVRPDDLANVVCFLASDAARAVHGALVPVSALV